MLSMFIVGRLIGRVDTRLLLAFGLGLTAWAMYEMTGWTPDVSQWTIVSVGFAQGAGLGFLFVPMTTTAFSTLPAAMRGEGTGVIQFVAQYRIERRNIRGDGAAYRKYADQSRQHLGLCDTLQPCFQCAGCDARL
jgi:hypothetical protein